MYRRTTHVIVKSRSPILRRMAWAGVSIMLVAAAWLLYEYGRSSAGFRVLEAHQREAALSEQAAALQADNDRLQAQVALLEKSSGIDRQAYEEINRTLADLQNEMLEMRQEVAFYRGIVNAEEAAAGLQIQSLRLRQDEGASYRYRLAFTHLSSARARVQGRVDMTFIGMRGGEEVEIGAAGLVGEGEALRFRFRNFQELRGVLDLPGGFLPLRVHVRAVPTEGRAIERTFSWGDVLS